MFTSRLSLVRRKVSGQLVLTVGRDDQRHRLADRFGGGVAIDALGATVPTGDDAGEGLAYNSIIRVAHDGS
jgi:hypothetical protein